MKGVPGPDVRETIMGKRRKSKLFSKAQQAFYAEHAPEGIELDDLSVLGPIFVLKLKYLPKAFDRRLVAEMWLYPDGSRILELSTKCAPDEAFQVAAETRSFLAGKGVDLGGEQETKTRKALEFFCRAAQDRGRVVATCLSDHGGRLVTARGSAESPRPSHLVKPLRRSVRTDDGGRRTYAGAYGGASGRGPASHDRG